MRRIALLIALPMLATIGLAACGSSPPPNPDTSVSANGTFGKSPTVQIPAQKAGSALDVKTLITGSGVPLGKTDAFVGNYAAYIWSGTTHKLAQSTWTNGSPAVFSGQLLPGLETGLRGKKMGSRVLIVLPPKSAYGTQGNSQAGVKPTDTLVFVVDLIKNFSSTASASGQHVSAGGSGLPTVGAQQGTVPSVSVPSSSPPGALVAKTLIKGSGSPVAKGQTVVTQYVGMIWRSKKTFDSSWQRSAPFGFTIGLTPSQVIPGWDKGLLGQTVGSRVMIVIPPADGYGSSGNSQAGITGKDTLVFVVDLLGAFSVGST
jgi:peptidylprolyl isomerase